MDIKEPNQITQVNCEKGQVHLENVFMLFNLVSHFNERKGVDLSAVNNSKR